MWCNEGEMAGSSFFVNTEGTEMVVGELRGEVGPGGSARGLQVVHV